MSDMPRRTLRDLIARHGPDLCSDAKRCEALLRDLCGAHRREINILMSALEERVPLDLLAAQNAMPRGLLLARLARRLEDQQGLTEGAARWAVDSWALALGVVTDDEVRDREKKAVRSGPPPAKSPAPQTPAPPPVPPTRQTRSVQPPAQTSPPIPRPTQTRPSPPAPATHAGRPAPAGRTSSAASRANAPAPTTASPPAPSQDPPARRRRGSWRGCLIGCFLLVLLSLALFFGLPFAVSVLREEQQRRGLESPPVRSQ